MVVGLTPIGDLLPGMQQRPILYQLLYVGGQLSTQDEAVVVLLLQQVSRHPVPAHPGAEVVPGLLGVGGDADVAVLAAPGRHELAAVAKAAAYRRLARIVVGGVHVLGGGGHRLLHRDVHPLPRAGHHPVVQGNQDGDKGPVRRRVIRLRAP